MRWDDLFEELEAEFLAASCLESEAEILEMVHAEAATVDLTDRLRHRVGAQIHVRLRNSETRHGVLHEANHAWIMIHDQHRRFLIPHAGIAFAWPLGGAAPRSEGIAGRLTLGYALRKIAAAGLEVRLLTDGGAMNGRIGMVGADYCDLRTPTGVVAVPWAAIVAIEG